MLSSNEGGSVSSAVRHGSLWAPPPVRGIYLQNQQQAHSRGHPGPGRNIVLYHTAPVTSDQRNDQQKSCHVIDTNPPSSSSSSCSLRKNNPDHLQSNQTAQLWSNCAQTAHQGGPVFFAAALQNATPQFTAPVQNSGTQIHVSQTTDAQQQEYMNTIYIQSTSSSPHFQHGASGVNLAQKHQQINVLRQDSHQTNNVQYMQQPVAQSQSPSSHMTRTGTGVSYVTGPQFHASSQGNITRLPPPPYSTQRNTVIPNQLQLPNVNQTQNSSVIVHAPAPRVSTVIQNQINPNVNMGPRSSLPPSPSYTDQLSFLALRQKQQSINQRNQSLYSSQKLLNCGVLVTQALQHTSTVPVSGPHMKRFQSVPVQQGNVVDSNGQCRNGQSIMLKALLTDKASNSELINCPTSIARLHSYPGYTNISTSTLLEPPSKPIDFSRGSPAKLLQENNHNTSSQLQYSVDPNECLEVVMALQKRLKQTTKAVAVVPPVSHHATDHDVVGTDKDSSIKIDAVWTLATEKENMDVQPKALDLPVDCAMKLEGDKRGNGLTAHVPNLEVLPPRNSPASVIKVAESEPEPMSPDSPKPSQEPTPSAHLKAKSPVEQRGENNVLSPSVNITSHVPNIPVKNLTLQELRALVKSLEVTADANEKQSDVLMCLMDLYWGGNVENLKKALKQMRDERILKGAYELSSMKKYDVVLQCFEQKNLKMLEKHYHILQNEIVVSVEEFRSSWQNVGEQPPDINSVLAEPLSDYEFTWPKNASQSQTFHQQDEEKAIDLSAANHKDVTQSVGSKPLVNDKLCETANFMKSEALSKTEADPALFIKRSKPNQLIELNLEKSNEQAPLETNRFASQQSSHVQSVQNDEDIDDKHKKNDVSGDEDPTSDPVLLEVPLCDSVEIIFTGSTKNDLHSDFLQFLQEESKTLTVASSPAQKYSREEIKNNSFANNIKFTCPHVTEVVSDLDYFCPKCWDETPLINLDLDETMLSPESGLNIKIIADEVESKAQSGKLQDETVGEDATQPVEINSTDDESVITSSPNPSDESLSSNSLFGVLPGLEPAVPVCNNDDNAAQSDITSPTEAPSVLEPICLETTREKTKISRPTSTAFPKSLSDKGDTEKATEIPTSSMQNASSARSCLTTTSETETAPADNALSSCKVMKKSTNEQKHCRDSVKDSHDKDIKHFPNMTTFLKSVQTNVDTYRIDKISPFLNKSVRGTKKGGKEVRLVLYGTPRNNSDKRVWHIRRDENRTFSAPTCVTISSRADSGSRNNDWKKAAWNPGDQKKMPVGATTNSHVDQHHSDQQSARMKVYKQWSSSFVSLKPLTSSSHKMLKVKVVSKMDKMTKTKLKFKESKLKSFQETLTAGQKRKREESFSKSCEKKRLKRASSCV